MQAAIQKQLREKAPTAADNETMTEERNETMTEENNETMTEKPLNRQRRNTEGLLNLRARSVHRSIFSAAGLQCTDAYIQRYIKLSAICQANVASNFDVSACDLQAVDFAQIKMTSSTAGTVECETGRSLDGDGSIHCENGSWTALPNCTTASQLRCSEV